MKKRVKGQKLSRKKAARFALKNSLVQSLIILGKIKTTKVKAKFAQRYLEKLVRLAKKDNLASQRQIFARLGQEAAKKLISEIAPKFAVKTSGFTRIINLGARRGDAAPTALLEFAYPVDMEKETKDAKATHPSHEATEGKAKETKDAKATKIASKTKAKGVKNAKKQPKT